MLRSLALDRSADIGEQQLLDAGERGDEASVPVAEVLVEGWPRDARLLDHTGDRGGGEALSSSELDHGLEQPLALRALATPAG